MAKIMIRTVRELVDAFGGTGETAKFLGIVPSNVSNWLADDDIPRGHHLPLWLEAQRRGFRVSKRVFGLDDESEHPKQRPHEAAA